MKLANPLYYPLAVLVSVVILVVGVRVVGITHLVMLPVSVGLATIGSAVLKAREPESLGLAPALEREFQAIQQQADDLVEKAQQLRGEATKALTEANQMDLLVAVEEACDRTTELPAKLRLLARRLQGGDSLLSVEAMQHQLKQAESNAKTSSGIARQQYDQLVSSLRRNIQLAREGQDARQAQILSLSTFILDTAGVLQKLQNQLRTTDFNSSDDMAELAAINQDFQSFQDNVDLLIS